MADPTPSRPAADRNLLFGMLALQMDFITREALIQALHACVQDRAQPLGAVLRAQGALRPEWGALAERMVQAHLEAHGHQAAKSLAALSSLDSLRPDLERIADPDLQASLAQVSAARAATVDFRPGGHLVVGTPTATGQRFRILRPHAQGGLGQVSVALDQELRREVALKELQARFADNPGHRARFLREADITGALEHPGVVPVYGLGADADGRPFYAMRLIKGDSLQEAITRFHQATGPDRDPGDRRLALRELLGRFVAVCQAVAYAHSRGVVHRDLKPANVMLGPYGETLVVDWGLARPMDQPGAEEAGEAGPPLATLVGRPGPTRAGQVVGTPAYMSPEQAAGECVGPASDVYSLGATLYGLLTGRAPFVDHDLGVTLQKVKRGEFPRPRQVQPSAPAALEAVCLKAMAQRPKERYARALELADEVEHWLADEPVKAYREPYRVHVARWLRRHQAVAAGGLALLLTATVGLGLGLYFVNAEQARTETARQGEAAQRQVAERSAAEAKAVLKFFQEQVLAAARPESQNGGLGIHATIRDAVQAAEPKIMSAFADQPLVEAAIRNTLGQTYWYLREDPAAIRQLERALALRRADLGPDHPDTLDTMNNLALAYQKAGQLAKVRPLLEEILAKRKEQLGPNDPDTLSSLTNLAYVYYAAGQVDRALPLLEQALAGRQETLGLDHPDTLKSLNNLAIAYQAAGQLPKALPLLEQALARRRAKFGPDHLDTLEGMNNLALAYWEAGQPEKARPLLEQALAKRQKTLGADHPDTLSTMSSLAMVYRDVGRLDKALALLEPALAKSKEKLGPDHPDTLQTMNNLALVYKDAGQLDKAVPLYEQALTKRQEKLGPDHPDTLNSLNNLARSYEDTGRRDQALPLFEQALAKRRQKLSPDHPDTLLSMNNLGRAYLDAGQLDKALPLLVQALALRKEKLGPDHPFTLQSLANLAYGYQVAGQLDKALPLLEQALAQRTKRLGPDHRDTLQSMSDVAGMYLKTGAYAQAEQLLRKCQVLRAQKQPDAWQTFNTQVQLGACLLDQKKYAEAEPLLLAGYEGMNQQQAQIPAWAKKSLTDSLDRLVQLYDAWGKPDQAAHWRAERDKLPKPAEPPKAK